MKAICFLINQSNKFEEVNYVFLANALLDKGFAVYLCLIDSLSLNHHAIIGKCGRVDSTIIPGNDFLEIEFEFENLEKFSLLWLLSFGTRKSFLDKIEILWILSQKVKVINSIESLLFIHSKYSLVTFKDLFPYPETHASSEFDFLWNVFSEQPKTWVIKPAAESFGKDVFIVKSDDKNAKALLQNMTGHDNTQYCILQEYVPEIELGEKRVLLAHGQIIGYYQRTPAQNDYRTNIHQGAQPEVCELEEKEVQLCREIGEYLLKIGAVFIGIDMVFPYIIEINVLNPGGLSTLKMLHGEDYSKHIINLLEKNPP